MKARIAVLGGDGIGPEVAAEAVRVLGPWRRGSVTSSSSSKR
jgi:isocitrate/isopropylmalate dehydrogenase